LEGLHLPVGAELREPAVSRWLRETAAVKASAPGLDLNRFLYLHLPPGLSVPECVQRLEKHPWVEYVEPDGSGTGGSIVPNDVNFEQQWHHRNATKPSASIHTPDAWDITLGETNIIVAMLDSGLRPDLSEFAGRTLPGYNFVGANNDTADDHGHGTAVAATLCANANNVQLIAGVDWQCRVLPVKVLDQNNHGLYSWWAQGIDFAVSQGAKVINLSAGGFFEDFTLTSAITNAIAHGVIFVTITHNDASGTIRFPGSLPECITVGATDSMDARASFSNYGPQIDLVAPGQGIATISTSGTLEYWSGTSLAAPMVAGVCSLLTSVRPGLTHDQARTLLCAGADDGIDAGGEDTEGFDNYYGWGRLNAFNSLVLAQTRIDQALRLPNGSLVLSWISPPNAADKHPYQIEFRTAATAPWVPLDPASGFSYEGNRTYWTDDGSLTGSSLTKFYRVRLRSL
jgi:hypothetical protein